jgi:phospholipid transport system transporter-binding protein
MNDLLEVIEPMTFETVEGTYLRFQKFLAEIVHSQHFQIILDFKKNIKCDGSGLALLIECKKQCDKHGILLYLSGVSNDFKQLMEFYGIVNWFFYKE